MTLWWVLAAALVFMAPHAHAVEPDEMLSDPALEARARAVSQGLRCLVCQNQSIDDSDAELARDLRVLVRERLAAGDSDAAVVAYVVSRYGDFVLLKPPLKLSTVALWAAPVVLLAAALIAAFAYYRRQGGVSAEMPTPLSAAEQRRLDAALRNRPR